MANKKPINMNKKKSGTSSTKSPTKKKTPLTNKKKLGNKKAPQKKKASKKLSPIAKISKNKVKSKKTAYKGEEAFLASVEPLSLRKNERYMNKRQRTHFEKILNSWKMLLMIEQNKTALNIQKSPTNFPDQSDRASQEEEFTLELRTRERERKLLSKIEKSIKELIDLDYGYCKSCGIEIGIRRLEARPTATRCIDCKTLEEIKERQNFG
jgi:DnaK suppressor protein